MRSILVVALALSALTPAFLSAAGTPLEVRDAWIREAPPTAGVLAAYMVISNAGTAPAAVSTFTSPDFGHVELHRTVMEGGVASMIPVDKLEIPAGASITLEPGGSHLMLIDPRRPLREGDTVTLIFQDGDGHASTFAVPVIRETGEAAHHHHH